MLQLTNNYLVRCPELDLPNSLHQRVLAAISAGDIVATQSVYTKNSGVTWWQRLFLYLCLDRGRFQIYRLPDDLVNAISDHYQQLIKGMGRGYKIRLKSVSHARYMFPHSDTETMDGALDHGDRCSLVLPIITNGEHTNYYEFSGKRFRYRVWDFLRLRPAFTTTIQDRQAWLYNNVPVHSVTNCDPAKQRFLLAISWQDCDFDELTAVYQKEYHDRRN